MFAIILKILKFLIIWLVIAVICLGISFYLTDSVVLGLLALGALFGIWLIYFIIKKTVIRFLARKKVQRIVKIDKSGKKGKKGTLFFPSISFGGGSSAIYTRFKNVISYLNKSNLSKENGDATYSLPWYLIVGDNDDDKEALLNKCGYSYPLTECKGLKSEDNDFDLYLTHQSILINSSKKIISEEGQEIPESFLEFIKIIKTLRRKEPINGIVFTINVKKFIGNEENDEQIKNGIEQEAQKMRYYLNYLMKEINMKLPVIIVLTGAEELQGFSQYAQLITSKQKKESLGNHNLVEDQVAKFTENTLKMILHKVKNLLNSYLIIKEDDNNKHAVLNLPREINQLSKNFKNYLEIVFEENKYEVIPSLRGIYITGLDQDDHYVFANELFSYIIPNDRAPVEKIKNYIRLNVFAINLGYVSILALFSTVVLMSWFISNSNKGFLEETYADYDSAVQSGDLKNYNEPENLDYIESKEFSIEEFKKDIRTFNNLYEIVTSVESNVKGWWIPWFGMSSANYNFVNKLEYRFYNHLQKFIIKKFNFILTANLFRDFSPYTQVKRTLDENNQIIGEYVKILYYRINLLNKFLEGATKDEIYEELPPFLLSEIYFSDGIYTNEIEQPHLDTLNALYIESLFLREKQVKLGLKNIGEKATNREMRNFVNEELIYLNELLTEVISHGDNRLQWIIGWTNVTIPNEAVTLDSFWSGTGSIKPEVKIGAAYTKVGQKLIWEFIENFQSLYKPEDQVYKKIDNFKANYKVDYIREWEKFASLATLGDQKLRSKDEWYAQLQQFSTKANPYFLMMDKMASETKIYVSGNVIPDIINPVSSEPFITEEDDIEIPEWIPLLQYYLQMKEFGKETEEGQDNSKVAKLALKALGKAGKVGKTVSKTAKKGLKTKKKLDKAKKKSGKSGAELNKNLEKSAAALDEYIIALGDLALQADITNIMYTEAKTLFQNTSDPAKGSGPLAKMYVAVKNLQFLIGLENKSNKAFWNLYKGGIYSVQKYIIYEAETEINNRWNTKFLAEVIGIPQEKFNQTVFSEGGNLWAFFDDNLKTFFDVKQNTGYLSKTIQGLSMNFNKNFVAYISQAREGLKFSKAKYPVTFRANPITVDKDALYKPIRTTLSMNCGDKAYNIINLNFISFDTVEWTPECGDLTLEIDFSVFSLTKVYKGSSGLLDFLEKFEGNSYVMRVEDFPEDAQNLRDIKVNQITINYNITGKKELYEGVNSFPKKSVIPKFITKSWQALEEEVAGITEDKNNNDTPSPNSIAN